MTVEGCASLKRSNSGHAVAHKQVELLELHARAAELQTRLNEALFNQEALRAEKDHFASREQSARAEAAASSAAASARSEQLARALASAQERCRVLQARARPAQRERATPPSAVPFRITHHIAAAPEH